MGQSAGGVTDVLPAGEIVRRLLAERHGVPMEAIWVGNGAAEAIDLALRAVKPTEAALAAPGFAEYETAVAHAGGRTRFLPLSPDNAFAIRAEDVRAAAAAGADAIVLGHPNNPTGQLLASDVVEAALDAFRGVVVDEAFLDFSPEEESLTLVKRAAERPGLFVTRSLTKFYAIPALRLGYVVAHPDDIARIRALAVPWSANGIALEVGVAALADRDFAERTLRWLPPERSWLTSRLSVLGLRVFPSAANYVLARLPADVGAGALQAALGCEGVLVRSGSTFRALEPDAYIRFAVKKREMNERLIEALAAYLATAAKEANAR